MQTCHFIIRGLVQGVGYRYFVLRQAVRLELRGWVRNLPGGEVEVLARGPAPLLKDFEILLNRGPSAARVLGVEAFCVNDPAEYEDFHIEV